MWTPSAMELIVILIVALLVFGPRKLPEIGKAVGGAVTEFKKGISGVNEDLKKAAESATKQVADSSSDSKES